MNHLNPLPGDQLGFRGPGAAGQVLAHILGINRGGGCFSPETEFLALGVVGNKVESDPNQPGTYAAIATKRIAGQMSSEETILGDRVRGIAVRDRKSHEPEHLRLVLPNHGVNIVQLGNVRLSRKCDELDRDRLCHHSYRRRACNSDYKLLARGALVFLLKIAGIVGFLRNPSSIRMRLAKKNRRALGIANDRRSEASGRCVDRRTYCHQKTGTRKSAGATLLAF